MALDEIAFKAELDQSAANQATKVSYDLEYYRALLAAGQGALDQSRAAAQQVQTSAAAIGTLYGTVLGVTFSVSNRQLPFRGIAPAVFLGLAIALSSVYVAYLGGPETVPLEPLHSSPPERLQRRLTNFLRILSAAVERRSYWLRASVVALAVGVILLPVPFLALTEQTVSAQSLNARYPWPDTTAVSNPAAATDQELYRAQVAEVAAQRQSAIAQRTEQQPLVWVAVILAGLALVLVIPLFTRRDSAGRASTGAGPAARLPGDHALTAPGSGPGIPPAPG